ncbi:MAG: hypothetical protein KZQ95_13275 [Candidatus Thiodiazotropha sp. (ex Epidulcina cf. delphinae)]|nr:hypothetical protein [Candidatus Thiodiazotropha sp. (ex Epidulcina cf. delphinae)]
MEFYFLVRSYDFSALQKHALYLANRVDVHGLHLSFDKPSPTIRKLFAGNARAPDITLVPNGIGQQEMDAWNGLWVSAMSGQEWSYVASKQEVKGKSYWSINAEFQSAEIQLETIRDIFLKLVNLIRPDLAFGFDEYGAPYNVRYFSSDLGLWAGLRDVYWLNYYGEKYTNLIGFDRIKETPQVSTANEIDRGLLFVVDKPQLNNRQEIINKIGKEYFVSESIHAGANQSTGIIGLIKTIYQLSHDKNVRSKVAARRPLVD